MRSLDALLSQQGELSGARVLVRSDLNVPMVEGRITDDGRVRASIPTIRRLVDAGTRVVVAAHLGRPKGEVRADLSLAPVAERLGQLLGASVGLVSASSGPEWVLRSGSRATHPRPTRTHESRGARLASNRRARK